MLSEEEQEVPEHVAMEPSMVCICVSLLTAQLPTHCWHSVIGKDNRLVDTAKQFYPGLTVHEYWAAVSQELVRNGVPKVLDRASVSPCMARQ